MPYSLPVFPKQLEEEIFGFYNLTDKIEKGNVGII
jgi:MFS-type transporter involved in bile tolerance (Atg22 family)